MLKIFIICIAVACRSSIHGSTAHCARCCKIWNKKTSPCTKLLIDINVANCAYVAYPSFIATTIHSPTEIWGYAE